MRLFVLPKLYCLLITGETEDNISFVDNLVLVSLFGLIIVGEDIIQC